jgi:hypothetical protein
MTETPNLIPWESTMRLKPWLSYSHERINQIIKIAREKRQSRKEARLLQRMPPPSVVPIETFAAMLQRRRRT